MNRAAYAKLTSRYFAALRTPGRPEASVAANRRACRKMYRDDPGFAANKLTGEVLRVEHSLERTRCTNGRCRCVCRCRHQT